MTKLDILQFYEDMRNPHMTIDEVLKKHNTNLKEALSTIRGYNKEQTRQMIKELKECKKDTQ